MLRYIIDFDIESINENKNERNGYLESFEFLLRATTKGKLKLNRQLAQRSDTKKITLNERNSKYYYNSKNYSMIIEPIYDEDEIEDIYYQDEEDYYLSSESEKYNVTVIKKNGEEENSIVYLQKFYVEQSKLETFDNGYIGFEDKENSCNGWYDENGNKTLISDNFIIYEIKDDKVFLKINNDEEYDINTNNEINFMAIDMEERILLQTNVIDIYENMYIVKDSNNKIIMLDKELNAISDEYDRIISDIQMDMVSDFSSY